MQVGLSHLYSLFVIFVLIAHLDNVNHVMLNKDSCISCYAYVT